MEKKDIENEKMRFNILKHDLLSTFTALSVLTGTDNEAKGRYMDIISLIKHSENESDLESAVVSYILRKHNKNANVVHIDFGHNEYDDYTLRKSDMLVSGLPCPVRVM